MNEHNTRSWSHSLWTMLRSILAILMGMFAECLLSRGTVKLRFLDGSPFAEEPTVSLIIWSFYMVLGSYIAARFAPTAPMLHALVLGGIWFVWYSFIVYYYIPLLPWTDLDAALFFSPTWVFKGLIITALPCAWLGGILHRRLH